MTEMASPNFDTNNQAAHRLEPADHLIEHRG